ncbi:MAG TPA: glycosyltransferase family 1 protein [Solirubrobacteraceae bacterium]|nr:glycosyltransferase family 1 protein [Solirubrobacteraceae bacterium]
MTRSLPARIGINAVFLEPPMGGLETYVRAVVPELVRLAPTVRFHVFCSRNGYEQLSCEDWSAEVELVVAPLSGVRGLKAISEMTLLGVVASRRVDLLHSVAFTAPLWTRAVNVVMLPDVIWIMAPDEDQAATMRLWRLIVPPIVRRADRLIAISNSGADDIAEHLHVPRERIDVVPLGPGVKARVAPTPEASLRERLGLGSGPIVLAMSAKKAHKNLARLIEAMRTVTGRHPTAVLVLPGMPTAHEAELRALAAREGLGASVAFPPHVDEADLEGLYAAARCFVLPSLNEGFGLPILEAMRREVPVACSNVSAMPEVAGDAARYFDPLRPADIAAALLDLLGDRELTARLIAAGRERARAFSWTATAERTLACYERAWRLRYSARS